MIYTMKETREMKEMVILKSMQDIDKEVIAFVKSNHPWIETMRVNDALNIEDLTQLCRAMGNSADLKTLAIVGKDATMKDVYVSDLKCLLYPDGMYESCCSVDQYMANNTYNLTPIITSNYHNIRRSLLGDRIHLLDNVYLIHFTCIGTGCFIGFDRCPQDLHIIHLMLNQVMQGKLNNHIPLKPKRNQLQRTNDIIYCI